MTSQLKISGDTLEHLFKVVSPKPMSRWLMDTLPDTAQIYWDNSEIKITGSLILIITFVSDVDALAFKLRWL